MIFSFQGCVRLVIKCWIICSVTEERMVFAVDLQRWVRGHSTCWPVLLTSESNLCWGPLVTGTVSWGGTGWKEMNSWTDFLSPCCLMLGANLLISIQKASLMFVLTCHISLEWFFQSLCILISVQVCFCRYVRQVCDWKVTSWNPCTVWENVWGECKLSKSLFSH